MWNESDTYHALQEAEKAKNTPYIYPPGAENCIPADGAKTRPAVAKRNWFNRLMCFVGIHDDILQRSKLGINFRLVCRDCNRKVYLK